MDYEGLPKTRAEALEAGSFHYYTAKPCKHGHLSPRFTKRGQCMECGRADSLANYYRDPGAALAKQRARYEANREDILRRQADSYKRNREKRRAAAKERHAAGGLKARARARKWYEENTARHRETVERCRKERKRRNRRLFKAKINAGAAKRRAIKRNATTAWMTDEHWGAIFALYDEAARLTDETGIDHHVDHIVPLISEHVSGLHVPWNLRVVTAEENLSKGNRLDESLLSASA